MKKLILPIIFVVLLLSSLVVNSAYATKGWVVSLTPYKSHNGLNQIGKMKICGDHICMPLEYENMKKSLSSQKINAPYFFQKLGKIQ